MSLQTVRRTRIHLDPLAFAGEANKHRTPGLHLTDIIQDIMLSAFGIDRSNGSFTQQDLENFQLQGYLWEQIATEQLARYARRTDGAAFEFGDYIRIPEIAVSLNGLHHFLIDPELPAPDVRGYIIMSPDGARLGPLRLLELKWSTVSINTALKPEWFYQVQGYLKGLSLMMGRPVNDVEWLVQFACGDYRGSGVITERWEDQFSDDQIESTFAMLAQHALDRVSHNPQHVWGQWIR